MTEEHKYYSVQELADEFRRTKVTIVRWIDRGFFPGAYKDGPFENSEYRVPQSGVDHFKSVHLKQSNS